MGKVASVESLSGVSQKEASLKVDLLNQSLLLHHINEEGEAREIARMASLGLPRAGSWLSVVPSPALGLHLRASEIIPIVKYRLGLPIYIQKMAIALPAQSQVIVWVITLLVATVLRTGSRGTTT